MNWLTSERFQDILKRGGLEALSPRRIAWGRFELLPDWTNYRRFHRLRRELGVRRGSVEAVTLAVYLKRIKAGPRALRALETAWTQQMIRLMVRHLLGRELED